MPRPSMLAFHAMRRLRTNATFWLLLGSSLWAAGCATVSPSKQDFLILETPRFVLVSAFGREATEELASDLEAFEASVDFVLGEPFDPSRDGRTLVLAFDDRGPGRRFAIRGESAYWLPTVSRPILVFRAPGAWSHRASRKLLHHYAHRLIRSRARERLPYFLEEGLAQLIGAIERHGSEIRIGVPVPEYVDLIRDWRRSRLDSMLYRRWSPEESPRDRTEWSAICWAIVHMEWSASAERRTALLQGFGAPSAGSSTGSPGRDILDRPPEQLAQQINEHLELKKVRVDRIRAVAKAPGYENIRPVPQARSSTQLGELALELGRPSVAMDVFEDALVEEPDAPIALVGLARSLVDAPDRADELANRAEALGRRAPGVEQRLADRLLESARRSEARADRERRARDAGSRYRRVLTAEPSRVEALVGFAAALILLGEGLDDAEKTLDRATKLRPGALAIDLERARLAERRGYLRQAEMITVDILSRTHEISLIKAARDLFERSTGSSRAPTEGRVPRLARRPRSP